MTTPSSAHIPVEAPRSDLIGKTLDVDGCPVVYVAANQPAEIRYRKYLADYSARSERPWKLGRNSYASLPNALRALGLVKSPNH